VEREVIYRNKRLLEAVRHSPCQHCGIEDGTVVAAHSNQLRDGKGKGIKAHDYRIAALCHKCHYEIDQGSKLSKQERLNVWEEAHRKTVGWLFDNSILILRPSSSDPAYSE
jgi:hypothetical protein